jgi:hypothetical protein
LLAAVMGGRKTYMEKVMASAPIVYFPLNETSGSTAINYGTLGVSANGTYKNTYSLANKTLVHPAPLFPDTGGAVDIYTTALRDAFDGEEGAISLWVEPAEAVAWATGSNRIISLVADNSVGGVNAIQIATSPYSVTYGRLFITYAADGTSQSLSYAVKDATPLHVGLSWSLTNDRVRHVIDGTIIETDTGLGTWGNPLKAIYANIAAYASSGSQGWPGWVGDVAIYDREITPAEWQTLHDGGKRTNGVFCVGDSKTDKGGGITGFWPGYLAHDLRTATGLRWSERPLRFGISGYTTAQMKTYIDNNLAALTQRPAVICINLGTNDLPILITESEWKASYTSIIDSLRAKWPGVPIYCAKLWERDSGPDFDTMAGWIDDIIATYPSGVAVGMDERIWLENGDDGATYTTDGCHYSLPAHVVCSQAWIAGMGY